MTSTEHLMSETFMAGADARAEGLASTANPYPIGDARHKEWSEGWRATFDLDEEDDPASNRMHKQDDTPYNA